MNYCKIEYMDNQKEKRIEIEETGFETGRVVAHQTID